MKVEFGDNRISLVEPADCPDGTMFEATFRGNAVLVIKVHGRLYVCMGELCTAIGNIGYNDRWYDEWQNPRILKPGEQVIITA